MWTVSGREATSVISLKGYFSCMSLIAYEILCPCCRMQEKRAYSAAAFHPAHGWVISGGYGDREYKSSVESTRDGLTFKSFTELPLGLWGHCLVSLEGVESGDFLLTGGAGGDGGDNDNKKTFIYGQGLWRRVEDMPSARQGK